VEEKLYSDRNIIIVSITLVTSAG